MFQQAWENVLAFFAAIPFTSATWFVLFTLGFFVWLFAKANNSATSPVRWEHLVVDSHNDRASPYKAGYLVGMIVGTWIVLTFADKDKLTFDIFGLYLTYLLGGASWNSFMKAKGGEPTTPVETPKEEPVK